MFYTQQDAGYNVYNLMTVVTLLLSPTRPDPTRVVQTTLSLNGSTWLYSLLLYLGRFFSFSILYTVGVTPLTWDQPVARLLPTHRTRTHNKHTNIHALSGIRTHDPSVRASEDSSCVGLRCHCDRQAKLLS
jgi:hypothetical protein